MILLTIGLWLIIIYGVFLLAILVGLCVARLDAPHDPKPPEKEK